MVAYWGRVAWPGCRYARIRGDRPLRQIGTLPRGIDPKIFTDYLLTLGIKSRVDDRPEGWLVWIYNEDQVGRASDELQGYRASPAIRGISRRSTPQPRSVAVNRIVTRNFARTIARSPTYGPIRACTGGH